MSSNQFEGVNSLLFVILHYTVQYKAAKQLTESDDKADAAPQTPLSVTFALRSIQLCLTSWLDLSAVLLMHTAHSYMISVWFRADHALQGAAKSTTFSRFQSSCQRFAGLLVIRLQSVPELFVVAVCSKTLQCYNNERTQFSPAK